MKVKIVAILTVVIIILMYVPVYADTPIPDPPTDVWEYWVIVEHPIYDFWVLCSHNPIKVSTEKQYWIVVDGSKYYIYENDQWKMIIQSSNKDDFGFSGVMYQANHDIAYEDGSGFFFLRPRVSPLSQTMKVTDFGTILRTFSAGLIPLIGCLILVISLRKGWEFLRTQLTH